MPDLGLGWNPRSVPVPLSPFGTATRWIPFLESLFACMLFTSVSAPSNSGLTKAVV